MFQSDVLFEDPSHDRSLRERTVPKTASKWSKKLRKRLVRPPNSSLLAEGDEATATCLGQRPSRGGILMKRSTRIIHRTPSVEEATATCLGISTKYKIFEFFSRKNAPNGLFLFYQQTKKESHLERTSYLTYSIGKGKEYSFEFKKDAVFAAKELGIKPAARKFKIAKNTMKAWLKNFEKSGHKGLEDRRNGPKYIPNKTPSDLEEKIVSIRTMVPCFGPKRIKYFYNIACSEGAIRRIIKAHKLTRKRRKVKDKRRDMREVKAKRKVMEHLQMDVKYLTDIPNYWEQIPLGLPKFQYTVRETKSGMLFLGYSDELSELNARMMVDYVIDEVKRDLPFDIANLTVQTDNGTEFSGLARSVETAPFVHMIEKIHGANHVYIRPGHCNAQADVESSHELIEKEFFDLTRFTSRENFFKKIESYRLYFNFRRPNFYKGRKTPQEICASDWGSSASYNFSLIKTVDLDRMSAFSYQRGQSIPDLTDNRVFNKNNFNHLM